MKKTFLVKSEWHPTKVELGGIKIATFREPEIQEITSNSLRTLIRTKELSTDLTIELVNCCDREDFIEILLDKIKNSEREQNEEKIAFDALNEFRRDVEKATKKFNNAI